MSDSQTVVAGYDGSGDSADAVEYALAAARDLGLPLRVVHCHAWAESQAAVAEAAGRTLAELCATLQPRLPDHPIQQVLVSRSPAATFIAEARSAAMVVIGYEGMGTHGGVHTSAVSRQVANQATGPVVVARSGGRPDGPVILAVGAADGGTGDGSDGAGDGFDGGGGGSDGCPRVAAAGDLDDAMAFAFAEAARREVDLHAVQIAAQTDGFGDILALWNDKFPDVDVRSRRVHRDSAVTHLVAAARQASLLVVSSAGVDGERGPGLGRLPSALLSSAPCPVAVVNKRS